MLSFLLLISSIFNVGAGTLISYDEIASFSKDLFGIIVSLTDVDLGKERVQSVRAMPLDISRAREELNYNPAYTFEKAFKEYSDIIKAWKLGS